MRKCCRGEISGLSFQKSCAEILVRQAQTGFLKRETRDLPLAHGWNLVFNFAI